MKKVLSLVLSATLAMAIFAGCGADKAGKGESVKTGLAVISSVAKSADAGEKDGLAQVDSTVVAVTVGADGKIVKCAIDNAQTKINFSKEGKILTDKATVFVGKQELGETYGMKKSSGIGKEWSEQATAFADYVVGKTVDEVKGIAVNDKGAPSDKDLAASVTVHITDFVAAIEKAVANAQDVGAKSTDKLGLGVVTTIAKSADVGEKDGVAQAYSYYTATTFGTDGKITSCVIDASQSNVNFSKEGKITSDLKAELKTKNELGDAYGMKAKSGIGKEWNEQANAFAKYAVGKTVDEVKGIALKEGVPAEKDLTSSVTVHVTDLQTVIEKAGKTAK